MMPRTDWLARNARYFGDRVAVAWEPTGEAWTYAHLDAMGNGLAAHLTAHHGLRPGDRVACLSKNSLFFVRLFVACQKAGFVLVPLNWRLAAPELAYQVTDADPALLVASAEYENLARTLGAPAVVTDAALHDDAPPQSGFAPERPIGFDDAVMILYTSGTTGRPKGAIVTHGMLFWNSVNTAQRLSLTGADVSFNAAPFYHTGGWNVLLTPFLHVGAQTLLLDGFDPARVLALCGEKGFTILWGVPTMLAMMADAPAFARAALGTVRYAVVGGEAMPAPLIRRWQEAGVPIRQGFGMTEVGPNCFSLPERDATRKIGSIGLPNLYVETRVVDDDGRDAAPGTPGELLLGGPAVSPGYWRNPEATAASRDGAWFKTGDLVRVDDEGYFYVAGRKKDLYISGGENVYPAKVEAALRLHESVADCAVVGAPDARWGETGAAFVVLRAGHEADAAALAAHLRAHLAAYKVPRHYRFVEALPVGHSGKILKTHLRDAIRDDLSAPDASSP